MKRRVADNGAKVKGYYTDSFTDGFMGDEGEGRDMLERMGLDPNLLPFSAAAFLRQKRVQWYDMEGNTAIISFKLKPDQMECQGSYKKGRKSKRLFCEWGVNEDEEMIARLESEAIGNLCMKCIYENMNGK